MHPDTAYDEILRIEEKYRDQLAFSEADTRCKLIDRILISCLGWQEDDISREDHVQSGFIDYKMSISGLQYFVIEAKKVGDTFEVPMSLRNRFYKISGVISKNSNLIAAMKQVRAYCFDTGIKYAIVTNGFQYVLFESFVPGKDWSEGTCIIFKSLLDIIQNFIIFWNIFSKDAVIAGSFIDYIEKQKSSLQFSKLINEVYNPEQKWERNRIYTYLADIVDFVFTEIIDNTKIKILRKCYVFDRSNQSLGKDLDNFFIDKLPYFAENYKINDIIESEKKAGIFERTIRQMRKDEQEFPLVVLLGGIGSGKSTFIHRFFKIVLENRESLFWFYLDFRNSSYNPEQVEKFVYDQIIEQFENNYKNKIVDKLVEIGFSPNESNSFEYLKVLFSVLKLMRITPTIVVDNVDQHEFAFQEKLFIFANYLCKTLNVLTILALREETFIQSTKIGVFDAYQVTKFHISSPNFIKMLKLRIEYTLELLHDLEYTKQKKLGKDIVDELIHFFDILYRSFNKDNQQSKKIIHFFDSISVGNMREALRMINSFLISGNTNIDEMFDKETENDAETYQIAYHQLLKSIILGEHRFYKSERSHIANLFDFDTSISDSHFQQLRILHYLKNNENSSTPIGRGFVLIDDILHEAEEVLIKRNVIIDSMLRMAKFNLIAFDNQSNIDISNASYVTITASGKMYIESIIYEFIYLDSVEVDTPISDPEIIKFLKKNISTTDLATRILKTSKFVRYLEKSENEEFLRNPQYLQSKYSNISFGKLIKISFNEFIKLQIAGGRIVQNSSLFA
jgi:hypothetical protein